MIIPVFSGSVYRQGESGKTTPTHILFAKEQHIAGLSLVHVQRLAMLVRMGWL